MSKKANRLVNRLLIHVSAVAVNAFIGSRPVIGAVKDTKPKVGNCYRCGKKLQGVSLILKIDGKSRTVCPGICQPKK